MQAYNLGGYPHCNFGRSTNGYEGFEWPKKMPKPIRVVKEDDAPIGDQRRRVYINR